MPPYYAVIFSNKRRSGSEDYAEVAAQMEKLVMTMPGYLGFESARDEQGFGISVSYWETEDAILNWKKNAEHSEARRRGRAEWYQDFTVRVAKVERAYDMHNSSTNDKQAGD
ncbi:MAG: antibiotic biosynthesis monooxygenase [Pseudomonadota bacterium]